jgi:hypothetical protein
MFQGLHVIPGERSEGRESIATRSVCKWIPFPALWAAGDDTDDSRNAKQPDEA